MYIVFYLYTAKPTCHFFLCFYKFINERHQEISKLYLENEAKMETMPQKKKKKKKTLFPVLLAKPADCPLEKTKFPQPGPC